MAELTAANIIVIDGPQALAFGDKLSRACEQQVGAAAKTPSTRPLVGTRPYAGFICSSLDFFAALDAIGMLSATAPHAGACEVYPADVWKVLTGGRLPKKGTRAGRMVRRRILEQLGVTNLPVLPTHDQNDACLAAVIGAAVQGHVPGITCGTIGQPLIRDARGALREGFMIRPLVSCSLRASIVKLLTEADDSDRRVGPTPDAVSRSSEAARAEQLLQSFVSAALQGAPVVCTYSWAYRAIYGGDYKAWSQSYASRVMTLATRTTARDLRGLGNVRLDTFIVSKATRLPSGGHWGSAQYSIAQWREFFEAADLLHGERQVPYFS